jgi:predicted double-glycine peptidase
MKKKALIAMSIVAVVALILYGVFLPYPHPDSYEVKDFKYLEQPDQITCGPTSATMLLKTYGKDVTLKDVKGKTKTQWFKWKGEPVGMTSPDMIASALTKLGVKSRMKRGNLNQIKYYVSQNRPPIVLLRSGNVYWHYVVVIGYDKNNIIVADPGSGKREVMKVEHFVGAWTFRTDMDGKDMTVKCETCKGTGHWMKFDLGPLSRCEICDGTGRSPDLLVFLLKVGEVYPNTLIVPSINTPSS